MAQTCLFALAVIILIVTHGTYAKRGCSNFGHSCYGGHGKRSSDNTVLDVQTDGLGFKRQLGQEETPPHPVYPQSLGAILQPGDDIIPIRDGGAYEHEETAAMRELMKMKLRNMVKQWIDNYRRRYTHNVDEALSYAEIDNV